MQRIFTRDVGRFKTGETRDYARSVWTQIERSASVKGGLDAFTRPVEDAARDGLKRPAGRAS